MIVDLAYPVESLIAAGANKVAELRDPNGLLVGYEIEPTIDLSLCKKNADEIRRLWLKEAAARKRYEVETAGIVVDGVSVATDRASRLSMVGLEAFSMLAVDKVVSFKAANGWHELTVEQARSLLYAVSTHIQACFAAEATLSKLIDADSVISKEEIEKFDWPRQV